MLEQKKPADWHRRAVEYGFDDVHSAPGGASQGLGELGEAALEYAARGWFVFPLRAGTKDEYHLPHGHKAASSNPEKIAAWWKQWPDANIGVNLVASGLVAVDPDVYKPDCEWHSFIRGRELGDTYVQRSARGGWHYIYSAEPGAEFPGTLCRDVEVKHKGYVVLAPSTFEGKRYTVERDDEPAPAPEWLPRRAKVETSAAPSELQADDPLRVLAALDQIQNPNLGWEDWNRVGLAVYAATGGSDAGRIAFEAWSARSDKNDPSETRKRWEAYRRSPPTSIGAGTLFHLAAEARRAMDEVVEDIKASFEKKAAGAAEKGGLVTISAAELDAMDFPPIRFVVPGYIAEGCTLFVGSPKIGKSWFCLQGGIAVASGGVFMGERCEPGDVLYLALEDNRRRLQSRIRKLVPFGAMPSRLHLATECPRAKDGGLDTIRRWIAAHPGARMVIVDVLAQFRDITQSRDSTLYAGDYAAIKGLQSLAMETGIAVVIVHHTRKAGAEVDPFETVSGTMGLSGAADTTIILARGAQGTTLYGRGRDVTEFETAVTFDKTTCLWRALGDATEVRRSDERTRVIKTLEDAGEPMSPKDIAEEVGISHDNAKQLLRRMVGDGQIEKEGRGRYRLVTVTIQTPVTSVTLSPFPPEEEEESDNTTDGRIGDKVTKVTGVRATPDVTFEGGWQ